MIKFKSLYLYFSNSLITDILLTCFDISLFTMCLVSCFLFSCTSLTSLDLCIPCAYNALLKKCIFLSRLWWKQPKKCTERLFPDSSPHQLKATMSSIWETSRESWLVSFWCPTDVWLLLKNLSDFGSMKLSVYSMIDFVMTMTGNPNEDRTIFIVTVNAISINS